MVDIQSPAAEIKRGKKIDRKIERKIVTTGQKYNGALFHRAAIRRRRTNHMQHENIMVSLLHRATITNHSMKIYMVCLIT